METILPIVIVLTILLQAGMYARAVFLRRQLMLNRVLDFLDRSDATVEMKATAQNAFEDALSVRLPINIMNFSKSCHDNPGMKEEVDRVNVEREREWSSEHLVHSLEELNKIVGIMFYINRKFNKIIYLYVLLRTLSFSVVRDKGNNQEKYLLGSKPAGYQH